MQRLPRLLIALGLLLTSLVATAQPGSAAAAPPRADGHRITLLVHGFDREADQDCAGGWKSAKDLLLANGWTDVYTFGYYGGDKNCDLKFDGTTDTRIQEVGRQLAWTVYYFYSGRGVAIDIMAHSMGGLVTRAAIEGVRRYGAAVAATDVSTLSASAWPSGWPPYLYIEDVVTLGTPHKGIDSILGGTLCPFTHEQCSDMKAGSGFLSWLGGLKSSAMGTDYTILGSAYDDTVGDNSSTKGFDSDVSHVALYYKNASGDTISHSEMRTEKSSAYDAKWRNLDSSGRGYYSPPLIQGMYGLYNHMMY
ncbi:esterase/lipase family protein [Nonomuraea sp. NPDC050556]|uniref:esterase/lipase family protein n=1 Tax=Nonomuraea sp. NPDC050556 TaxID=3364369 RepID=UPI00379B8E8B